LTVEVGVEVVNKLLAWLWEGGIDVLEIEFEPPTAEFLIWDLDIMDLVEQRRHVPRLKIGRGKTAHSDRDTSSFWHICASRDDQRKNAGQDENIFSHFFN